MSEAAFDVHREAEAAKELLAHLRQVDGIDDEDLVADGIEGETGLIEAIEAAMHEIDECEVIEAGAKAKADEYSLRAKTAADRKGRIRSAIEQALVLIDLAQPLRLPAATLSITKRAPQLVVGNEAEIPARFFVEQPRPAPRLDKKALTEALSAGETIPGATLDNGTISLLVRRR